MTAAVVHDAAGQPFQLSMTAASGAGPLASPVDAGGHAGVLALIGVGFVAAGIVLVLRGRPPTGSSGRDRRSGAGPGRMRRVRRRNLRRFSFVSPRWADRYRLPDAQRGVVEDLPDRIRQPPSQRTHRLPLACVRSPDIPTAGTETTPR